MAEHIDQSTAPLNEKLRRYLEHIADPKSFVHFHYDGFPRPTLASEAYAFLADIAAGRLVVTNGVREDANFPCACGIGKGAYCYRHRCACPGVPVDAAALAKRIEGLPGEWARAAGVGVGGESQQEKRDA